MPDAGQDAKCVVRPGGHNGRNPPDQSSVICSSSFLRQEEQLPIGLCVESVDVCHSRRSCCGAIYPEDVPALFCRNLLHCESNTANLPLTTTASSSSSMPRIMSLSLSSLLEAPPARIPRSSCMRLKAAAGASENGWASTLRYCSSSSGRSGMKAHSSVFGGRSARWQLSSRLSMY